MAELDARKLKYPNTGTEALLMGILVEGTSLTTKFLRENGITLFKVRDAAKCPSEDAAAHDAKKSKKTIEPENSVIKLMPFRFDQIIVLLLLSSNTRIPPIQLCPLPKYAAPNSHQDHIYRRQLQHKN